MIYAHRGASAYAPENTMTAFRLATEQGANGIETDVKRTKDGVLVLFHDDDLMRLGGIEGTISDYTYDELSKIDIHGGTDGQLTDKIPTLEEFLQEFSRLDIGFAIELKQDGIEQETVEMLDKYGMNKKRTEIISFSADHLKNVKDITSDYELGYIVSEYNEQTDSDMQRLGIKLISPRTKILNAESVAAMHNNGYRIQSWGAYIEKSARYTYDLNVDAMTIDFPDVLLRYMREIHGQAE